MAKQRNRAAPKNGGGKLAKSDGAKPAKKGLTSQEMAAQQGSELPDREAMSLITANVAAPINAAVAANILSDDSIAYAEATQTTPITQEA